MENHTGNTLKDALSFLEEGNPLQAQKIIETLFEKDLDSKELIYTNRCCTYWIDSNRRLKEIENPYERGERLLDEWKNFKAFMAAEKHSYEPAFYSVQRGFFSKALNNYKGLLEAKDNLQKAGAYRKTGICYKKLGDFENARDFLTEANSIQQRNPQIIAELADCYSLCGEDKISKVLFREAFFIDSESIDLEFLDSELIKCLAKKVAEKGFKGKLLLEWIPVYGVLYGIFNVKRELHSQDVIRLKTNIFAMENEYKDPSCSTEYLTPRLLNSYFWLIDHYVMTHEESSKVNEILLKIKILDSAVYEMYVK